MFKNFFFGEFSPVNEESLELGWLWIGLWSGDPASRRKTLYINTKDGTHPSKVQGKWEKK
jgi:hypothetical protein